MSCDTCKQKDLEKYNQLKKELKNFDRGMMIFFIIFLGLSIYGIYSLVRIFL